MTKIIHQSIAALLLCLLCATSLHAQERRRPMGASEENAKHEQMKELFNRQREEYLQIAIGLSDEDAKEFFVLYKALSDERYELYKKAHERMEELDDKDNNLTDEQYNEIIDMFVNLPIQSAELGKTYNEKFAKILTPKQLYRFIRAEQSFARDVVRDSSKGRRPDGDDRPNRP